MTPTAPTTPSIAGTLKKNPHTALVKDGLDEFGLYVEFVTFHVGGTMRDYHRRLYTREMIAWYRRPVTQSRTTWKATKPVNPVDAAGDLEAIMNAQRGVMIGSPILVQLDEADRATIAKGGAPGARFRGAGLHERIYGKFDPQTYSAPTPTAFNDRDIAAAILTASTADAKAVGTASTGGPGPVPEATITVGPVGGVPGPAATPVVTHHTWSKEPTLTVEQAAAIRAGAETGTVRTDTPVGRALVEAAKETVDGDVEPY